MPRNVFEGYTMKLGFSLRADVACFLFLLAITNFAFASFADAVTVGAAAPLAAARSNHTATQLTNGKLLVAGGQAAAPASTPLASTELYDPFANAWSAATALPVARTDHTATLLDNGRVLIVGGRSVAGSEAALATAVLYDPTTNTWSNAGNLAAARSQHTATRLRNGKILVVGGKNNATVLASAELYDPATNAWTSAGSLTTARRFHTATAASVGINDEVFVIGGRDSGVDGVSFGLSSIERYSASSNSWFTFTAQLDDPRYGHTATALPNGDIAIACGFSAQLSGLSTVPISRNSVERFVFTSLSVASLGSLRDNRARHSATLLPSGKILFAGGIRDGASPTYLATLEVFDIVAGGSPPSINMPEAHANHTATLMPTGAVLAVGGRASATSATATTVLSRVNEASNGVTSAGGACGASFFNTVTLLPDGRLLIVGGLAPGNVRLNTVQLFNPANGSCANLTPLAVTRDRHAATLLPNGKLLITGGLESNSLARNSAELYDPIANTTTPLPSMQRARFAHSQTL
ncbi:MAG: Kelch repeat-containing protein, partial [Casimicrobium sp.]